MALKEIREAKGLSQAEVAKKVDVFPSTVCRWENGDRKPCRKHKAKLAKVLGCKREEI